jgi:hypothetical protein
MTPRRMSPRAAAQRERWRRRRQVKLHAQEARPAQAAEGSRPKQVTGDVRDLLLEHGADVLDQPRLEGRVSPRSSLARPPRSTGSAERVEACRHAADGDRLALSRLRGRRPPRSGAQAPCSSRKRSGPERS